MDVLFAPAKLTLELRVTGVRGDGLHLIDAEMVTLDFGDRLRIGPGDGLVVDDEPVDDPNNLVNKALRLAERTAYVELEKHTAAGAGLGGGSADAAAVLRWCGFDDEVAAASIGADVAFCLRGGRARVTGIGEQIAPLPYIERSVTLLTPPLHCSTPAVYRMWDEMGGPTGENGNDLEPAALAVEPELATWRDELADATGQRPRLAGSGSSWFVEGEYPGNGRVVAKTTPASS